MYSVRASDPELYGCDVFVNNVFVDSMDSNQTAVDIDASDGDIVTMSNCLHFDQNRGGVYLPWAGSVSSYIDVGVVSSARATDEVSVDANPISTMVSAELMTKGSTSPEEKKHGLV